MAEEQQTGDFESVSEYIIHHVLEEKSAVSMSALHTIYGLNHSASGYRSKLKYRIMKRFKDQINFLPVGPETTKILVDASTPVFELALKDKSGCIIKADEYFRNNITSYSQICQQASASSRTPKKRQTFTSQLTSFLEAYVTFSNFQKKIFRFC